VKKLFFIIAIPFVILMAAPHAYSAVWSSNPCAKVSKSIYVDTSTRLLYLCKDGSPDGTYKVSLGRKGVGKTRQGDEKTPLGTYSLGHPRKSNEGFGTFINVGYPTRAQRSKGYTGSAIGVHGPKQKLRFFGPLSSFVDWTAGCIALATNKEMTEIAKWVKKNRVGKIHVRRGS